MRRRIRLSVFLALALVPGAVACRKFVTDPIYRRPVISSVVAFPTTLGPGDSTLITVYATDPNGDALVYDWEAFNGLIMKGGVPGVPFLYNTPANSMVFFRSLTWPYANDSAFVFCSVRDGKGGGDGRLVLILYQP